MMSLPVDDSITSLFQFLNTIFVIFQKINSTHFFMIVLDLTTAIVGKEFPKHEKLIESSLF